MANTLTNLIPDIYAALDVVSRERVGFIPAITLDSSAERCAVGQQLRSPFAPEAEATDVTPGVTPPDDGDQDIGNRSLTITKVRRVPVRWAGEQTLGINAGPGYKNVRQLQFAQAMRRLCNEVEADIAGMYRYASRAHGTAGTAPFGSAAKLDDAAETLKILIDNGAPSSDLHLVINTTAGVNLRKLTQLTNVNEAGSDATLRRGELTNLFGLGVHESAQIKSHAKGTGANYAVDLLAGYDVGATTLHVDTGTGTFVAGDVITVTDDPSAAKYIVATGFAGDGDGDIVIAEPGLQGAVVDGKAVTIGGNYKANLAFARSAIVAAIRAPALPEEGDSADDRMFVTDEVTGLSFEVSLYRQYRQIQYELSVAWGVACFKPEHMAILLG